MAQVNTATQAGDFIHIVVPGAADLRPLLLLHGTGGDERDLIPLAQQLAPGAPLLSVRGKVLEGGAPRFFRRFAEGRLDEADLRKQAADLAGFVQRMCAANHLPAPVALGFSNGANIAAALLMRHGGVLAGGLLLRAMAPFAGPVFTPDEAHPAPVEASALVISGAMDPIVPPTSRDKLVADLTAAGVSTRSETVLAAHGLTNADLDLARPWLAQQLRAV